MKLSTFNQINCCKLSVDGRFQHGYVYLCKMHGMFTATSYPTKCLPTNRWEIKGRNQTGVDATYCGSGIYNCAKIGSSGSLGSWNLSTRKVSSKPTCTGSVGP